LVIIYTMILISIAGLSYVIDSPVQRLTTPTRIETGTSYRYDLYRWSLAQSQPSLLGEGASQVKYVLNAVPKVNPPPRVQQTFLYGYPLWYTHSQLIDNYIAYGISGTTLLISLFVGAWRSLLKSKKWVSRDPAFSQTYICVVIILGCGTLNFLFNTPSLELTPLLFLALFSALRLGRKLTT